MNSPDIALIRNKGDRPVSIVVDGRQVVIAPGVEEALTPDLAQKFLIMHGMSCELVNDSPIVPEDYVAPVREYWLANLTGNPAYPAKYQYQTKHKQTGVEEIKTVDNPYAKPYTVRLRMHGGERFYLGADGGDSSDYNPHVQISIPPYTARKVPAHLHQWAMGRAAGSAIQGMKELSDCAPLPEFTPTTALGVDGLRVYLQLIDPSILAMEGKERKAIIGESEAQIKAKSAKDPTQAPLLLRKASNDLMKQIFFRLVDANYVRPTRAEFDSMSGKVAAASNTADAVADAIVSEAEKSVAQKK